MKKNLCIWMDCGNLKLSLYETDETPTFQLYETSTGYTEQFLLAFGQKEEAVNFMMKFN